MTTHYTRTCRIELNEIIDLDLEGFLDEISERAFGSCLLMDVSYSVLRTDGDALILSVTGDPSEIDDFDPQGPLSWEQTIDAR